MKQLSVIIPVYNVEKYVYECVDSVFRQGLDENSFEVIIVNDGTKDNSMSVIKELIKLHSNIIVIEQENQGLSVARNNGLSIAVGEYILMPDSDDVLVDNSVLPLLERALSTKADMIIADFTQMSDDEITATRGHNPIQKEVTAKEATGPELLEKGLCQFYWRSLYRREFLTSNHITFVPGIYSQDVPFTYECLLKARKCIRTHWKLMIYRHGHDSVSWTFRIRRAKDMCTSTAKVWELTKAVILPKEFRRKQEDITFLVFYDLISATTYGHLKSVSEMFEVIDFLKKESPDLNFRNGIKQRTWSFMYNRMPHTLILLRYWFEMLRRMYRKRINNRRPLIPLGQNTIGI